jgi:hypothetical protein
MNKKLVIGLLVLGGIAYYLYNQNKKKNSASKDANFSNFVRGGNQLRSNAQCGGCPPNSQCMSVTFPNGNTGMRCVDLQAGRVVK